jgi:uncharacterized membrane protein (DUF485 family)
MDIVYKIHNFFVNRVYANSLGSELGDRLDDLGGELSDEALTDSEVATRELVDRMVRIAVPLAIICIIVLVVYGTYILMSSQGNPDKIKEGKEVMTNAIIGFLFILLSVALLLILSNTLGLDVYTID